MSLTLWHFRLAPDGTFQPLTMKLHDAFFDGLAPLPLTKPGIVLTASVYVELDKCIPQRVTSWRFDQYTVNGQGRQTAQDIDRRHGTWMSHAGSPLARAANGGVSSFEARRVEQVVNSEFLWKPTSAQSKALVRAINHRAKRPIVGSPEDHLTLLR